MRRLKLSTSVSNPDKSSARAGSKRPPDEEEADDEEVLIRSVSLGSRKQLCINDALRKRHGDLDEACRQLLNGMCD
jgi:chromosome transmission fidelity protein 1